MSRLVAVLVALALVAGACAVGGREVERSPTPPEEVLEVGSVAHQEEVGAFIVHDPELGVVAFGDHDPASGCALTLVEENGRPYLVSRPADHVAKSTDQPDRTLEGECDGNRYNALDGRWVAGPSAYSLTPFDTYLGVDGHLYIEGEPQPLRDRLGHPIEGTATSIEN